MSAPRKGSRALRRASGAAQDELRQRLERIAEADPLDIHRARVAARRLRSLCKTFRPLLGRTADQYSETLKRLAGLLGDLRNIDVMASLPAMRSPGIAGPLVSARRREVRRLRHRLRSPANRQVLETCRAQGCDVADVLVPGDISRTDALRRTRRAWRRVAVSLQNAPVGERALHELRIALKKARYAVDAVDKTKAGKAFVQQLRLAQDLLGARRDLEMARQWLRSCTIPEPALREAMLRLRRDDRRVKAEISSTLARLGESGRQWERTVTAAIDA